MDIYENFIEEFLNNGSNATKEELREVLYELKLVMQNNKDKTINEIIEILTTDVNNLANKIINEYPIPGYYIDISSDSFNIKTYGGSMNETGIKMNRDAIFDIASITKLYTQIISYNLIRQGYYNFYTKVKDINPNFKNLNDLTIGTIMNFGFSFKMDGKIEDSKNIYEAYKTLYTISIDELKYRYIDHGMIILKILEETVTKKSFEKLLHYYIIDKLHLENTYIDLPKEKRKLFTGSPNINEGVCNDMKSVIFEESAGHAGIKACSNDLLILGKNLFTNNSFFSNINVKDMYLKSKISKKAKMSRGIMGNACTFGGSFIDKISPIKSTAFQGSTRTQFNIGLYNDIPIICTILFNPASMGIERAREEEKKSNCKFVTEYEYNHKKYTQISAQRILNTNSIVRPIVKEIAKLELKLSFLEKYIKMYNQDYNKKISLEFKDKQLIKSL